jgi:hypothetical protein
MEDRKRKKAIERTNKKLEEKKWVT